MSSIINKFVLDSNSSPQLSSTKFLFDYNIIFGTPFNDHISTTFLNDLVIAFEGNDKIIGSLGKDFIVGGGGSDTIDYSKLGQAVTLEARGVIKKGSAGIDTIREIETIVGAVGKANVIDASTGTSGTTSLDANLATKKLVINNVPTIGLLKFQVENFRNVIGTSRNDSIIGDNFNNKLEGRGGNDTIFGLGGNDTVLGGAGNDTLGGGNQGISFISKFSDGNDIVKGDSGNDLIIGGTGFDTLDGGTGLDTANYSDLNQAITVHYASFVNKGSAGYDRLVNIENIIGTSGNDSIVGNHSNNVLEGGAGNDKIFGNGGKDTLIGVDTDSFNPGRNEIDILSGGTGADTFVIGDAKDSYYTGGGGFFGLNDLAFITDFKSGEDKIQLSKSENYIFGKNFIAVNNFFKPYPLPLEKSLETSEDTILRGGELSANRDSSIADSAVNQIIENDGEIGKLNLGADFGAEANIPVDSQKSSLLVPIPFNFDIVAITANNYNFGDLQFV